MLAITCLFLILSAGLASFMAGSVWATVKGTSYENGFLSTYDGELRLYAISLVLSNSSVSTRSNTVVTDFPAQSYQAYCDDLEGSYTSSCPDMASTFFVSLVLVGTAMLTLMISGIMLVGSMCCGPSMFPRGSVTKKYDFIVALLLCLGAVSAFTATVVFEVNVPSTLAGMRDSYIIEGTYNILLGFGSLMCGLLSAGLFGYFNYRYGGLSYQHRLDEWTLPSHIQEVKDRAKDPVRQMVGISISSSLSLSL